MAIELYQWTLSGTLGGQFVQTVQHLRVDNTSTLSPFNVALIIGQDMIGANKPIERMMLCLPSDYVASSLRVKRIGPPGGPTAVLLASQFNTSEGQRTGEISSAQVNPLMTWIPEDLPAQVGRIFMPGVSEADIDQMVLSPALIAAYSDFFDVYSTSETVTAGVSYVGAVWHRASPPAGAQADQIVAFQISPLIGTQRKRLRPV